MSPEAIHSLIEMFGVEKGLHILNLFTALDDTELSHTPRTVHSAPIQLPTVEESTPREPAEQIPAD